MRKGVGVPRIHRQSRVGHSFALGQNEKNRLDHDDFDPYVGGYHTGYVRAERSCTYRDGTENHEQWMAGYDQGRSDRFNDDRLKERYQGLRQRVRCGPLNG